jgi:hypothetical protein
MVIGGRFRVFKTSSGLWNHCYNGVFEDGSLDEDNMGLRPEPDRGTTESKILNNLTLANLSEYLNAAKIAMGLVPEGLEFELMIHWTPVPQGTYMGGPDLQHLVFSINYDGHTGAVAKSGTQLLDLMNDILGN